MLFVHGSVSSGRMWRRMAALVDGQHECPDLTGAIGTLVEVKPDHVLAADLAVLEAALDRLDTPTTIVAHSYGGFLALQLALRHPHKVRAIVAHEPVLWQVVPAFGTPEEWKSFEDKLVGAGLTDPTILGHEGWTRAFVEFWNGPQGWVGLPPSAQQGILQASRKTQAEVELVFHDRELVESLHKIQCPVRLTMGRQGHPMERRAVQLLSAELTDCELVEVEGAHLAPITHPKQLFEVWKPWLSL